MPSATVDRTNVVIASGSAAFCWPKAVGKEGKGEQSGIRLLSGVTAAAETLEQPRLRLRAQSEHKESGKTGGYAAFASHFSSIPHKLRRGAFGTNITCWL